METKRQTKSGNKSASGAEGKSGQNSNPENPEPSPLPPKERTKSRLRRHRSRGGDRSDAAGGRNESPDSVENSDHEKKSSRRRRKKRKKRKSSRATTGTNEESSGWTSRSRRSKSGIPTPEIHKKESKPRELSERDLVEWMQKTVPYVTANSPLWNKWTLAPFYHFIRNPDTMLCVAFLIDKKHLEGDARSVLHRLSKICQGNLIVFNKLIPEYSGELFYFLKVQPVSIDGLNYEEIVLFGNVPEGDHVKALNGLLTHYWTPIITDEECLPTGIKSEVFTDLNTVLCTTQTSAHFLFEESRTELFLYVPTEIGREDGESGGLQSEYKLASDKQFCSRLEETVVYWITKLKQVVAVQQASDCNTWPGPLEEIRFWNGRAQNLGNILEQLKTFGMKRLLKILSISHSPYLLELKEIFVEVSTKYQVAVSNAYYLRPLTQPLENIPKAKLRELRVEIQKVVWLTLTIWRNSPYYNTAPLLNGLLKKFSSFLIILCKSRLKVNEILSGLDIPKQERRLKTCVKCLEWWREIYKLAEAMHEKSGDNRQWVFEEDNIFGNVDAMVLRTENLLEICQVQELYRLETIPLYPGIKGPYISAVMQRCQKLLEEKLEELMSVSVLVLNVQSTEWHAHMKSFRDTLLAIDMSVQNVLEESFEQMANLKRRVELMQLFRRFYEKREVVTRQLDKLCVKLYENLEQEMLRLRKLFERKVVPLPCLFTEMAGKATWAELMKRRIEGDLEILKKADAWLPKASGVGFQNMVKNESKSLAEAMGAYATRCYEDWAKDFVDVPGSREDHRGKLEVPLLVRGKGGLVKVNFDRSVYRNLCEVEGWSRIGRSIPPLLLTTICPWKEKLHGLRENVGMIAKWYNFCVVGLSKDEKLLFRDRLLPVEQKIYPCLAQGEWTWTTVRGADLTFLEEFRELTGRIMENVREYREVTQKVAGIIAKICDRRLVTVRTGGRQGNLGGIYGSLEEFQREQNEVLEKEVQRIAKDYRDIASILKDLFVRLFKLDGAEVKIQWEKYVNLVDECFKEALTWSARMSVQILEIAVGSDDREKPLFRVNMMLEEGHLKFEPSLEQMAEMFMTVHVTLAKVVEPLVRLGRFLGAGKFDWVRKKESYSDAILKNEELLAIRRRLAFAVERCLSEVNLYAERWIPYRDIWEVGREEFVRNYEKQYPDIVAYEKDLKRYREISEIVHGGDSIVAIRWLQLDCVKLKEGVAEESTEWFRVLAATLYEKAKDKLLGVYGYMEENREKLAKEPENLEEQLEMWRIAQDVRGEVRKKIFASFPDIQERFRLLRKYEFDMEPEVEEMKLALEKEWRKYLRFLKETDEKLEASRDRMKNAFLDQRSHLKEKVEELLRDWEKEGPFAKLHGGAEEARNIMENFRNELKNLKDEEAKLMGALETFNLKRERNSGLFDLENDIQWLSQVWSEVDQWDKIWVGWKVQKVVKLDIASRGVQATEYYQIFQKLQKEFELKSWRIIGEMLEFIEIVQKGLKCCQFLRQQTLQQRHFEWIRETVTKHCGDAIDKNSIPLSSKEWSLEMVVSFRLDKFLGSISEISWSSEKEMAVEQTLEKIQEFWEGESFTLKKRKTAGKQMDILFEVECSPYLQDNLIDHIVSLTAMKGSQFAGIFQEKVYFWEETLKTVNLAITTLLEVQREWLVLDKVFCSEHIQREMAGTSRKFSVVTSVWASVLLLVTQVRNVLKVVEKAEDLAKMLQGLREKMGKVKSDLGTYLRGIRQELPRFYFVPDDQLLTCLGGGREIENYVEVMRKIFGNVGSVRLQEMEEGDDSLMIENVVGKYGEEELRLGIPVEIGRVPVESWFGDLEKSIKAGVQADLKECLEHWGGSWNKLAEWILDAREWTRQSVVTALKIQWTIDAAIAIGNNEGSADGEREKDEWTLKKMGRKIKRCLTKIVNSFKNGGVNVQMKTLEAVVITLIYLKDVTERLTGRNCSSLESFEWLQYLRWYWNDEDLVVKQGFTSIPFGWEYCGGRQLCVMTPLLERSFLAITTAIGFHMGAVVHGGVNCGKKETIQELGCQLGKFVINLRVDDKTEGESLKGIISGTLQSGVWTVFQGVENFREELIHMLESKLALITQGKLGNYEKIMLDGIEVKMQQGCGIFVVMSKTAWETTMRRDLIAKIKNVMRPVALIQPDVEKILEVKLFLGGFENSGGLAAKIEGVFKDEKSNTAGLGNRVAIFSLKSMLITANQAVTLKRNYGKKLSESEAVIKALESIIVPSLRNEKEVQVFKDLVKAHFPMEQETVKLKKSENFHLEHFVRQSFTQFGYESSEKMVQYCLQLYELIQVYKAIVIVGNPGTGKSVVRKILKNALKLLFQHQWQQLENNDSSEVNDLEGDYEDVVKEYVINPATVEGTTHLFGKTDSNEEKTWMDGIITKVLKNTVINYGQSLWLVFDGPVDWLPEVTKDLYGHYGNITLPNCERVHPVTQITTFFEVDNLNDSSPVLLASCGILYINDNMDNMWKLSFQAWFKSWSSPVKSIVCEFLHNVLDKCLRFRLEQCTCLVSNVGELQLVQMFTGLLETYFGNDSVQKLERGGAERLSLAVKQIIAFCITWSVFMDLNEESQKKASAFLKDLSPFQQLFPAKRTIFEYCLDLETQKWINWENIPAKLNVDRNGDMIINEDAFISTAATTKVEYLVKQFMSAGLDGMPVLVCGPKESGKSKLVMSMLNNAGNPKSRNSTVLHIQSTPRMTARSIQSLIGSRLEAASAVCLSPAAGKTLTVFVDDINENSGTPDKYTSSAEFIRFMLEYWMWYDSENGIPIAISNVGVIATMSAITDQQKSNALIFGVSTRLQRRFSLVYLPKPNELHLRRIFTEKIKRKLVDFAPPVKLLEDSITVATLEVHKLISTEIQSKHPFHVFTLNDISRVYEGLFRAHKNSQDTKLTIVRLWFHECCRVFKDRLMDSIHEATCQDILDKQLIKHFEISPAALLPYRPAYGSSKEDYENGTIIFGNFLKGSKRYEEVKNVSSVRKLIEEKLRCVINGSGPVILFREAILQVVKVARVLSQRKGHLIICGGEGQGRKTLTLVAASLYQYKVFEMPISNFERKMGFLMKVLKKAYVACTTEDVGCCILLRDDEINEEIMNVITIATSSVEVPDLFTKQEVVEICKGCQENATITDMMAWMKERVEKNLHVVLCVQSDQQTFFTSLQGKYSGLLKEVTVIWFDIWTPASFIEAGKYLLNSHDLEEKRVNACTIFYKIHDISVEQNQNNGGKFLSPMHFVDFVQFYLWYRRNASDEYLRKMKMLKSAIKEIADVRSKIGTLTEQADCAERKAEAARQECEKMLAVIQEQEHDTNAQEKIVKEKEGQLEEEIKEYEELASVIKEEWSEALGDFERETEVLQDLAEDDLTHIRSYFSPPPLVSRVLDAVMIMLERETSWPEAKIQIGHPGFIKTILEYDKARITQEKLNNLKKFIQNKEFTPESISKYSNGARILCAWIHAIEKYGRCYLTRISPKREKLESSEHSILEHKHILILATEKWQLLRENLTELQTIYDTKRHFKETLEEDAKQCSDVLGRATSVLKLLEQDNGSQFRNHIQKWKDILVQLDENLEHLEGNALLTAAFLAYAGVFSGLDRSKLKKTWKQEIQQCHGIKVAGKWRLEEALNFENILSTREKARICLQSSSAMKAEEDEESEWMGENIILIKKSRRPVLCVDPFFISNWEKGNEEKVVEVKSEQMLLELYESGLSKEGEQKTLFVTTKIDLENVGRRISSRFNIVNFTLSHQSLRNYLLQNVAQLISPEEESRRQILVQGALAEKLRIEEFTEKIPKLVISCGGSSILSNGNFPETLSNWQAELTASEAKLTECGNQIDVIECTRHRFLYPARGFTRLFQSIMEMTKVCRFYEISLAYFTVLINGMFQERFPKSAQSSSEDSEKIRKELEERMIDFLDEDVTFNLCEFAARAMKKQHCFHFLLVLCIKALLEEARNSEQRKQLKEEILMIIPGIPENEDYEVTPLERLDRLKGFHGLKNAVLVTEFRQWNDWLLNEIEAEIPEPWNSKLTPFQKLVLGCQLRKKHSISKHIMHVAMSVLGERYGKLLTLSRLTDVKEIYNVCIGNSMKSGTLSTTPVIFLMDKDNQPELPDPQLSLQTLAKSLKPPQKLYVLSLASRNTQLASKLIEEGSVKGFWVYLANCEVNEEWLYELEQLLKTLFFHRNFKLWMCTKMCNRFPREIIQCSVKVMVEAPANFQESVARLQKKICNLKISNPVFMEKFQQLLYALCSFHCKLQERNGSTELFIVQDSDFEVALSILKAFASRYLGEVQFPWWALKYMLELQYGNHCSSEVSLQSVRDKLQKMFSPENPISHAVTENNIENCETQLDIVQVSLDMLKDCAFHKIIMSTIL